MLGYFYEEKNCNSPELIFVVLPFFGQILSQVQIFASFWRKQQKISSRKVIEILLYSLRHTGLVENFNSMMLKYAPKRNAFEYQYYTDRMFLAAIDHNVHNFREVWKAKSGRQVLARKLNKRAKKFHSQPVKTPKTYPHIRKLLIKIVHRRKAFKEPLPSLATKLPNDPKLISPTLAGQPPSTESLAKEHISRLSATSN